MYDFSGELTDTDHCLVVAKVRERLAESTQAAHYLMWKDLSSGS
jgi:hypothetical protein